MHAKEDRKFGRSCWTSDNLVVRHGSAVNLIFPWLEASANLTLPPLWNSWLAQLSTMGLCPLLKIDIGSRNFYRALWNRAWHARIRARAHTQHCQTQHCHKHAQSCHVQHCHTKLSYRATCPTDEINSFRVAGAALLGAGWVGWTALSWMRRQMLLRGNAWQVRHFFCSTPQEYHGLHKLLALKLS